MAHSERAWILYGQAGEHSKAQDFPTALRLFLETVREFKLAGDQAGECRALLDIAGIYNDLGNYEASEHCSSTGLDIARRMSMANILVADHLDSLGLSKSNRGLYQDAITCFDQALEETDKTPTVRMRKLKAHILRHLADVYTRYLKDYVKAISLYDQSLQISEDDDINKAFCLTSKALCVEAVGEFEQSVYLHERARHIAALNSDNYVLGIVYRHLAGAYTRIGKQDIAREYCQKARQLDEKVGNKQGLICDYILLGQIFADTGDEPEALRIFEAAYRTAHEIQDLQNSMIVIECLAWLHKRYAIHLDKLDKRHATHLGRARSYYEEALALCRKLGGHRRSEIELQTYIAMLLDDPAHVQEEFEKQLKNAQEAQLQDFEQDLEDYLGRLFEWTKDFAQATCRCRRSVELLEKMRTSYRTEEYLRAFSQKHASAYERFVKMCIYTGDNISAFEYVERSRARVLAGLMQGRSGIGSPQWSLEQKVRYRKICRRVSELDHELEAAQMRGKRIRAALPTELQSALLEEEEMVLVMCRSVATDFSKGALPIITVSQVQQRLRQFSKNILILSYYTSEDDTYVFAIDKETFTLVPLGIRRGVLKEHVLDFRRSLGVREVASRHMGSLSVSATAQTNTLFKTALSEKLVQPVLDRILELDHVCIVPHGSLHYLPFHALPLETGHLIERKPLSYAPSVTTLNISFSKPCDRIERVLALGDPSSNLQKFPLRR